MSNTSATAQTASAMKAILDGYSITRIGEMPTIWSIKVLTMKICQMAAAVKSTKDGGNCGHMYLILQKADYRIATKATLAEVDSRLLKPVNNVNAKFKTPKQQNNKRATESCNSNMRQKQRQQHAVHHPGRSIKGDHQTDGGKRKHWFGIHQRFQEWIHRFHQQNTKINTSPLGKRVLCTNHQQQAEGCQGIQNTVGSGDRNQRVDNKVGHTETKLHRGRSGSLTIGSWY